MAESAAVPILAIGSAVESDPPRHSLLVRLTHWVSALVFLVLTVSGVAILLAHPRLYWGETGAVGSPSLIDLPLPFILDIPIRGPGRYLHFLAAWVAVATGVLYVGKGLVDRHFARNVWPGRNELKLRSLRAVIADHLRFKRSGPEDLSRYNAVQRLSYTLVVFGLGPLLVWTGLAMSPAVVSVFPFTVTAFGGQQSARTIHFFAASALVLFVVIHVALVWQSGFRSRMRGMVSGRIREDRS